MSKHYGNQNMKLYFFAQTKMTNLPALVTRLFPSEDAGGDISDARAASEMDFRQEKVNPTKGAKDRCFSKTPKLLHLPERFEDSLALIPTHTAGS